VCKFGEGNFGFGGGAGDVEFWRGKRQSGPCLAELLANFKKEVQGPRVTRCVDWQRGGRDAAGVVSRDRHTVMKVTERGLGFLGPVQLVPERPDELSIRHLAAPTQTQETACCRERCV
jgi:hypothetical protein